MVLQRTLTVVAVVAFLAIAYLLLRSEFGPAPEPASPPPASERMAPAEPPVPTRSPAASPAFPARVEAEREPSAAPAVALPPLAESDAFVRERLEGYGLPDEWVGQDDLVRRLAVFADNATRGELARRGLRFLAPEGSFRVVERDGRIFADPRNARRFDAHLDLLEGIEPERAAALIDELEPLLDEAMAALGSPDGARVTLEEAVARILDAPAPVEGAQLVRPKVLYRYADPELESLPPLEKQLMRIGPSNLQRLKAWLVRFERALAGVPTR